ncbi:hypothetical protein WR25_06139 [Diploscapter pachys]|uniref:Homeobox domain-containing protein n=1 Tax=Diploscapter pachys TaxID=2018661 RepID=A0A2A2JA10_9BILA|nr:hypothetical protein WR25_06139 [Diploscapter pachys]
MTVCSGCRQEILDRYILRVYPNMEFHSTCLKCVECGTGLDEQCSAFVKHDRTYCREDYLKLFGTKCLKCGRSFEKSEMVMRAGSHHVLHIDCFRCSQCDRKLVTGEEFAIRGDQIYCRADASVNPIKLGHNSPIDIMANVLPPHHPLPPTSLPPLHASQSFEDDSWETSTMTSLDHTTSPPLSVRSPRSDGMTTPANGGPSSSAHNSSGSSSGSGNGPNHSGTNGTIKKKKDKQTTRVRTVLNESQLMTLKRCYQLNQRPDAMMKEQLVELTGLNARVIRVWFQNKRCKDKKRQIQMRDYQINAEKVRLVTITC